MRRNAIVMLLVGIACALPALAQNTEVPTYTGCYSPSSGTINKLAAGNAPQKACNTGDMIVSFSPGDITKISVTGGLTGGGSNGDITISLDPKYSLPQNCSTNFVAKWTGTAWQCAADENTTYTAGNGLNLANHIFSLPTGFSLPQNCQDGEVAKAGSGGWQCAGNTAGLPEVWTKKVALSTGWSDNLFGDAAKVISLSLPVGTYIATVIGNAQTDSYGESINMFCNLSAGPNYVGQALLTIDNPATERAAGPISITGVFSLSASATLDLECYAGPSIHMSNISMTAIKAGVVHTQ